MQEQREREIRNTHMRKLFCVAPDAVAFGCQQQIFQAFLIAFLIQTFSPAIPILLGKKKKKNLVPELIMFSFFKGQSKVP